MREWKRCRFESPDKAHQLEIDVIVDNGIIQYGQAYYGVWREIEKEGVYPLMFVADGHGVDYGHEYGGGKSRYGTMKIHGAAVQGGVTITYEDTGGPIDMVVREMYKLA